ncbi:MAG: hypothetical protein IJU47_00070 [Verrucomicrobia bacterium]|nr:hypothetical protein [Verrucomicrobiota bacterium]
MKKLLFSLILAGIASSVFFSMQASEEPVTAETIGELRFGILQKKIYPTPEYTAAVRKETLPRIEKFVEQQGISLEQPIEAEAFKCQVDNSNYPACFMRTTNGFKFTFNHWGKVEEYSSTDNWFDKDDEQKDDPKYLGKNRMTSEEIESYARDFLKQQGYGESFAYYKTKPTIEGPLKTEKGTYPYVEVEWVSDPENFICANLDDYYFLVQIDTDKKKLIGCRIYPSAVDIANNYAFFAQDPVQVKVKPMLRQDWLKQTYGKRAEVLDKPIHIDTVYSNAVTSFYISQAKACVDKLDYKIPDPIELDEIKSVRINGIGYLFGELVLKNGYSFTYDKKGYPWQFSTPYAFFTTAQEDVFYHPEKYYGTNRMTTNEIVKLAEESLKKFGYDLQNYTNSTTVLSIKGPFEPKTFLPNDEHEFPYARVNWSGSNPDSLFGFNVDLNTDKKEIVNIEAYVNCLSEFDKRPALEIGVYPETEEAYQARIKKEEAAKN